MEDDLDAALTTLRVCCSKIPVHQNAARQLQRRFTYAATLCEDLSSDLQRSLLSLFQQTISHLQPWLDPEMTHVMILARNQHLVGAIRSAIGDLSTLVNPHLALPVAKWELELEKACADDLGLLDEMVIGALQDQATIASILGLDTEPLAVFLKTLEDVMTRTTGTQLKLLRDAYKNLESPKTGSLKDLTSRIKLLGDRPLVTGSLSDFWLADMPNGTLVTVKRIRRDLGEKNFVMREAQILARTIHPNIITIIGIATIEGKHASVSPWMKWNAVQYLERNPQVNPIRLCWEACQGLEYVHSLGIVHSNIRPQCVLISDDGTAVLSNFIFAHPEATSLERETKMIDVSIPRPIDWTDIIAFPSYVLWPSQERGMSHDILDFGGVMCKLVTGRYILGLGHFSQNDLKARASQTGGKLGEWFVPNEFPETRRALWDVIVSTLQLEYSMRPEAAELVKMLDTVRAMPRRDENRVLKEEEERERLKKGPVAPDLSGEVRMLGSGPVAAGGFCDVWMGERLGKEKVALKAVRVYDIPQQLQKRFMREVVIWSGLHHPNILPLLGTVDHGFTLFMVSPWLQNSNVLKYITDIHPQADRLQLVVDAAEGLFYLHTLDPPIIHGDLKGANILVRDDGTACLTDFGLSKLVHETTSLSLRDAGTQRYMAPELFQGNDEEAHKTFSSDIYAFGHVILELTSGEKPYYNLIQPNLVLMAIMRGERALRPDNETARRWLRDPVWEAVQKMTDPIPSRRPSTEDTLSLTQTFSNIFGKEINQWKDVQQQAMEPWSKSKRRPQWADRFPFSM